MKRTVLLGWGLILLVIVFIGVALWSSRMRAEQAAGEEQQRAIFAVTADAMQIQARATVAMLTLTMTPVPVQAEATAIP